MLYLGIDSNMGRRVMCCLAGPVAVWNSSTANESTATLDLQLQIGTLALRTSQLPPGTQMAEGQQKRAKALLAGLQCRCRSSGSHTRGR
jgi:hypothetical protein